MSDRFHVMVTLSRETNHRYSTNRKPWEPKNCLEVVGQRITIGVANPNPPN